MDGNFKLAPQGYPFHQVYIIRGKVGETASTLVYCLMESLDQAAYIELLNILRQQCNNRGIVLQPTHVHVDFELAVHNAIRIVFPNTNLAGCFYHLCQVR